MLGGAGLRLRPSGVQDGFYGQVWTDLSMVLGNALRSPTSQVYCGSDAIGVDGTLTACAERLWASLAGVADAGPADAKTERIRFLPTAALSMQWVNRPTTQHIAGFGRLSGPVAGPPAAPAAPSSPSPSPSAGSSLPATGAGPAVALAGLLLLTVAAAVRLRRS